MGFFSTNDFGDKNEFSLAEALLVFFVKRCFMKTEMILVGSSEAHPSKVFIRTIRYKNNFCCVGTQDWLTEPLP